MASQSSHTEPAHRHTREELLKPGLDHHLTQQPPCPDPSVHRSTKLQEQASTAALYVTKGAESRENPLDSNNKLSSRSAAMSLKYANPQELPSFPVVGINTTGSANQAANLANTNRKSFEHWKPDPSAAAGKAALLAKDYKMDPLWQPEMSAAGSKAALLAHRDGGKLNLWMPEATAEGNSAANIALRNKGLSPQLDYGYTEDGRKRALMAATGALDRSKSNASAPPVVKNPAYPDSVNSAHNALNAATVAHRPSTRKVTDSDRIDSEAMRAARVQNYGQNVSREMFTEHPPVAIEVEEKKRNDALRASAVSMAKQMYEIAEKGRRENEAAAAAGRVGLTGATTSHARGPPVSAPASDSKQQAMQYIHLQEAAQRLAKERLDKLDPDGVARYRAHYGYEIEQPRSRLSMRGRPRRRAESDAQKTTTTADDSSDDEMQARRIRNQMSGLNSSLAETDARKQKSDRAALLAAAERKVQAQMHNMDEKVFQETGKVSPAMMEEWEAKARAKASADSEIRQKNFGKVNIGGGRYMDQSELEAIALSRLQPTLDEISATAEKKRARDEELRLEREELKRQQMAEKEKERKTKAEAKSQRDTEKAAARVEKDAEKARKADAKRVAKDEKVRAKEAQKEAANAAAAAKRKAAETTVVSTAGDTAPVQDSTADTATEAVVTEETRTSEGVGPALGPVESHEVTQTENETESTEIVRTETADTADTVDTDIVDARGLKFRPDLDRHISTLSTSESELSSPSSHGVVEDSLARRIAERATAPEYVAVEATTVEPIITRETEPLSASVSASEPVATGTVTTEPAVTESTAISETSEPVAAPATTIAAPATAIAATTPVAASGSTAATTTSPSKAAPDVDFSTSKRKSRGFSGLFGKFRKPSRAAEGTKPTPGAAAAALPAAAESKRSADPTKPTSLPTQSTSAAAATSTIPTTPAIAAAIADDNASESSFRRHDTDMHSLSSELSSDEDEEDGTARRGRSGKASTELGDEEDEFEEARDHFDESLAPPPTFAGQAKSASPVRETKFQEVL